MHNPRESQTHMDNRADWGWAGNHFLQPELFHLLSTVVSRVQITRESSEFGQVVILCYKKNLLNRSTALAMFRYLVRFYRHIRNAHEIKHLDDK